MPIPSVYLFCPHHCCSVTTCVIPHVIIVMLDQLLTKNMIWLMITTGTESLFADQRLVLGLLAMKS